MAPTPIAYQDTISLLALGFKPTDRWTIAIGLNAGRSVHVASGAMGEAGAGASAGAVAVVTPAMQGRRIEVERIGPAITGSVERVADIPDEERIDRSWKGDLPVSVAPGKRRGFSAGSLGEEYDVNSVLRIPGEAEMPQVAFTNFSAPISAIAMNRFVKPRRIETVLADLSKLRPQPLPRARDRTMLIAEHYPPTPAGSPAASQGLANVVSAYAPGTSMVDQSMFDALFTTPRFKPEPPELPVAEGEHEWMKNRLPFNSYSAAQKKCLAEALYYEARSESVRGQLAVGQVVLNRVRNPAYPATICGVVYQNRNWRNRCQFSFACDGTRLTIRDRTSYQLALKLSDDLVYGRSVVDEIGSATHYHATYVNPRWGRTMIRRGQVGLHIFYQTHNGGWS